MTPSSVFKKAPLVKQSFFQRLLKQQPEENAVIELNNLLAARPVRDITKQDRQHIENKYAIDLKNEFSLNLEEFYAVYLNYCLADKALNDEEIEDLRHLKTVLDLDERVINDLHGKIGELVYKSSFEEAVADGRLTDQEKNFLSKLASDLKLPAQLVEKISTDVKTRFVQGYVEKIIADQALSPDEEQELNAITASLNVQLKLDERTQAQLHKYKLYWALKNLDLPVIRPGIELQKTESCHLQIANVRWSELRKERHGKYSVDTLTEIDRGTLYLTNKRIIFDGHKKNSNIRLEKILSVTLQKDGVRIDKDTGKDVTLQMTGEADVLQIMLQRLIHRR
jgi:hypothetical protein